MQDLPPITIVGLRVGLAAALIWVLARPTGARTPRLNDPAGWRLWRYAAAASVAGSIAPFLLITWGLQHIPSALAGLLMAPMPLMALALSHFFVPGVRMTAGRLAGFVIGLAGVVYLIGVEAVGQIGHGDSLALIAQLGMLLAALGYAISSIILKRAAAPDAFGISVVILALAALITVPLGMVVEAPDLTAASWRALGAIIIVSVGATALAQLILMKVIDLAGPAFLGLVNYQVPLWAVVFGVVFLGEELPGIFWVALALILAGLAIAQFAGRKRI